MTNCAICGNEFDADAPRSLYAEAGEWLADQVWHDAGELCHTCLENRARLVMMYHSEYNS